MRVRVVNVYPWRPAARLLYIFALYPLMMFIIEGHWVALVAVLSWADVAKTLWFKQKEIEI